MPGPADDPRDPTAPPSPGPGSGPATEDAGGPPTAPDRVEAAAGRGPSSTEAAEGPGATASRPGGPGEAMTLPLGPGRPDPPVATRVRYLGDYELLEVVGRGGMGVVYRARQISLNRVVALKLIRLDGDAGEAELRRFRHEAEAVASLDHPGIVPIYEVGTHDGRHYFSMKLIEGRSLQEAASSIRGDFRAIARVVAEAARAVHHAHERGILHRDVKPANILLDPDRRAHVTDFGLAKRLDAGEGDLSQTGSVLGTPAYMAPEQASATRGSVTVSTDVYGLGAVLYALLSGRAPHRGSSMLQVLDAAREHEPEPPSRGDAKVPRDLEVVCLKAMAKEPPRRYRSAGELADDLDRWLEGRPIAARRVGPAARALMWCRRKPVVAGLAAALAASALIGAAGILVNWREARRRRDELAAANRQVRAEWQVSRRINDFLVSDLLSGSSPFVAGRRDVPASALLERSAALATSRFTGQPKVEAAIRQVLGESFLAVGKLEEAEAELLRARQLHAGMADAGEDDRLTNEYLLARLRLEQGRIDQAETHALEALGGRRRRLGEEDEATLQAEEVVVAVLRLRGKVDDARAMAEAMAATADASLGSEHRLTLHARTNLAIFALDRGRPDEAVAALERVAATSSRAFGVDHPDTLFARSRLGAALIQSGRERRAGEVLEAALGPARDVLGPEHRETLRIANNLAAALAKLGMHDQAARLIQETLRGQRAALPADHPDTITGEINRAVVLLQQGRAAGAEPLLRDLVARLRARLGPGDPTLLNAIAIHAACLLDLGRTGEAEPLNDEALAAARKAVPAGHPQLNGLEAIHAAILLGNGKAAEAEEIARRLVEARSKPGAIASPWQLGIAKNLLGGALAARREFAQAEPLLLEGYEAVHADPRAPGRRDADALERVIRLYEARGQEEEAARWRARRAAPAAP